VSSSGELIELAIAMRDAGDVDGGILGKTHSATRVLAWNRALNYERRGEMDSARRILADELVWLLAEDPGGLATDQNIVRAMLADDSIGMRPKPVEGLRG
jgi:hypothetical protein